MEDLLVFDFMEIKSGKGVYRVEFDETSFTKAGPFLDGEVHIIIDSNLVDLYPNLTLVNKCEPSFMDEVARTLNPRNSNQYIEVWKTNLDK